MDEVIRVEALTKKYDSLVAVDDISFSVRRGEIFGILGPNGAGKTTTLECVEGLQQPSSGRISLLGMEVNGDTEEIKKRIGIQLQASAYFDYLTLREILDLFILIYKSDTRSDDLLNNVGLEDKAGATVNKLSGGQKQRFTIAATLVNDPEVVFLDEPTAGLDPQARRNLWDFVHQINSQGRTVVMTTHYMDEAEALCDRVAIMDRGRIAALDTPANLVRSLPVPYEISVRMHPAQDTNGLKALDSVNEVVKGADGSMILRSSNSAASVSALMEWVSGNGVRLTNLEVTPYNLEDVFLSFTGRGLKD